MRESPDALQALTEAIGTALRADAAVVRVADEWSGELVAGTVFEPVAALVLYTDGLVERRREKELYGTEQGLAGKAAGARDRGRLPRIRQRRPRG